MTPRLIQKLEPQRTELARERNITGVVRFRVVVGVDGRVERQQPIAGHPMLLDSAAYALKQYRYSPTLLEGKLVRVQTEVVVEVK